MAVDAGAHVGEGASLDAHQGRRAPVPISFTGDVAGFLFDLLSDIEAIVWEADADTFAIEFINDRACDLGRWSGSRAWRG
jgi:hypothetical protein